KRASRRAWPPGANPGRCPRLAWCTKRKHRGMLMQSARSGMQIIRRLLVLFQFRLQNGHADHVDTAQEFGERDDHGATAGPGGLPGIQANYRPLRHVMDDVVAALAARNNPPTIFQRGGLLARLRMRVRVESSTPYLEPLNDPALRG